ncbi:conserved hypothetical protein, partial [Ricinus communis]
ELIPAICDVLPNAEYKMVILVVFNQTLNLTLGVPSASRYQAAHVKTNVNNRGRGRGSAIGGVGRENNKSST